MPDDPKNPATSRSEQKKRTRRRLIEATIDVIAQDGFSGVTMAKVAEQAGLSRGIGNFHFDTKEKLLLETLNTLYREFEQAWQRAVTTAGRTPQERLCALIRAVLEPPVADHRKISVWLAYWGESPSRRTYMRICESRDKGWESAVEALLRELARRGFRSHGLTLTAVAESLTAMMDGFWLEYLLAPGRFSSTEAVRACTAFLSAFFVDFACPEAFQSV
jgi:TetR/AcrR family transcriptional repressor of bet genes